MRGLRTLFILAAGLLAAAKPRFLALDKDAEIIKDEYVVVFHKGVNDEAHYQWIEQNKVIAEENIMFKYNIAGNFKGYAAKFSEETLEKLLTIDEINYIQPNSLAYIDAPIFKVANSDEPKILGAGGSADKVPIAVGGSDDKVPIAVGGSDDKVPVAVGGTDDQVPIAVGGTDDKVPFAVGGTDDKIFGEQPNPPSWGLDRVDQRDLPLNELYVYEDTAGTDVDSYIIDTGIYIAHNDFGGRASWGENFVGDGRDEDCNGHGTHVAGTVGGTTYGIAKNTNLIAVKVLGCSGSGSFAGIIEGIEWLTDRHTGGNRRSVGNMSLGGSYYQALNDAVDASSEAGVHHVVSSGNDNGNACLKSPASAPTAISVGATTITDARSSFSNYGDCCHIFAPGSNIVSSYIGGPDSSATLSGTSMASPHVTGVVALIIHDEVLTYDQMKQRIQDSSSKDKISGIPSGTVNYFLYSEPPATTA